VSKPGGLHEPIGQIQSAPDGGIRGFLTPGSYRQDIETGVKGKRAQKCLKLSIVAGFCRYRKITLSAAGG
jgi:hypothetical protein